jgi:hypothetical protein
MEVVFIATDGDPAYDNKFKTQHKAWYPKSAIALLSAYTTVWATRPFFVSDLLHAAKNVRSRLLKYIPIIYYGEKCLPVDARKMNQVLQLGEVFTDTTSTGKMRDAYPLALFRLEHVLKLLEYGLYAEAVYLAPWALLFRAVLSDKLDVGTRIFTLGVALSIFSYFEQSYQAPKKRTDDFFRARFRLPRRTRPPEQGSQGLRVTPLKWITLIRVMATTIAIVTALHKILCDIPLDRIGTHPLENFFGLLRRLLHDCNMFAELLRAMAKNCVVQRVMDDLYSPRNICGRANTGGIVSRRHGGVSCIPTLGSKVPGGDEQQLLEGILASLDMQQLLDGPPNDPRLLRVIDAFEWIVDLHNDTMTPWVDHSKGFCVRGTANSKIVASFLQRRQKPADPS